MVCVKLRNSRHLNAGSNLSFEAPILQNNFPSYDRFTGWRLRF